MGSWRLERLGGGQRGVCETETEVDGKWKGGLESEFSRGQRHPRRSFIFTVYIRAAQVMVPDARSIIGIHCEHGAVAADLSIDGRAGRRAGGREEGREGRGPERQTDKTEIRLSSLSFLTWRGRPLGAPFSGKHLSGRERSRERD
ncbi:unnamed protein product, partial [Pleuronectes platessa]